MARDFTASGHVIDCGSAASTDQQDTFTYCAWVAPDGGGTSNHGRIVGKGDFRKEFNMNNATVTRGLELFVYRNGTHGLAVSQANVFGGSYTGVWKFVAATFEISDGPRLYYADPGALLAEEASYNTRTVGTSTVGNDSDYDLAVGNRPTASSANLAFDGRIAEVRCWNVVLSLAELQAAMRGFRVRPNALFFDMRLFGETTAEPDWSGNGNHGTVTGAVRYDHPPGISAYGLVTPRRVLKGAAGGGGSSYQQDISDAITVSASLVKGAGKLIGDSIGTDDGFTNLGVAKTLSDTVTQTDSIARSLARPLLDQLPVVPVLSKGTARTLSENQGIAASITVQKIALIALTDSVTVAETLTKALTRTLSENTTLAESFSAQKSLQVINVSDVISTADTIAKKLTRSVSDLTAVSDAIAKGVARTLSDTDTITEAFSAQKIVLISVSDAMTVTPSISRGVGRTVAETVGIAASLQTVGGTAEPPAVIVIARVRVSAPGTIDFAEGT